MRRLYLSILTVLALSACREEEVIAETPVRGLKTHAVVASEPIVTRRFPAVLEPSEIVPLSFEISGTVGEIDLAVGQRVEAGAVLASLDRKTLEFQVTSAKAGVEQARSNARNAAETLQRQQALLERGTVTRVAVDQAQVQADTAAAQLVQAEKSLETAEENLKKADLLAPFDGILSAVDATSFSTVGPGTPVVTVYPADSFEVSFSVSFDTVGRLVVGTPARVRLADEPEIVLDAVVSEIGARADAVSSFPVVLTLRETHPVIRAGMAVEAAFDLPGSQDEGFAIPLSAIIRDGRSGTGQPDTMGVYVFDPETSRVVRRDIVVGGIRENRLIVLDGLEPGERVASAGVSFLKDGQEVRLLEDGE